MFEYILLILFVIVVIALVFYYRTPCLPCSSGNVNPVPVNQGYQTSLAAAPVMSSANLGQPCQSGAQTNLTTATPGDTKLYLYPTAQQQIDVRVKSPVKTLSINTLSPQARMGLTSAALNVTYAPGLAANLPATFDSRTQWPTSITNPLNQVDCGSCWAFATATTFSDRYRITHPNDQELRQSFCYVPSNNSPSYTSMNNVSPYQVVRCNTQGNQQGCGGGIIAEALDFLASQGANSILGVPPVPLNPNGSNGPCTFNQNKPIYKGIKTINVSQAGQNGQLLTSTEEAIAKIKTEIISNGPVAAGFTVYNDFYDYHSGVYQGGSKGIAGGHAVVIVGWGVDYWIVRNSWGVDWGEGGYFNIKIDWKPPDARDPNGFPTIGILDEVWSIIA
jgi:cathepsin B